MNYKLLSLNTGRPEIYQTSKGELKSAYRKKPVSETTYLSSLNFKGDEQADKKNHGGYDKAVCLYPAQHYRHWEQYYEKQFTFPAFGENITVEGIEESKVHIGDIFKLGGAVLQITEPRKPCYIIARTHGIDDFPARVMESGYTGFYLRVLEEGDVTPGDMMALIEQHSERISVSDVNEVRYNDRDNRTKIKQIINNEALSESLRQNFQKRLQ